MRNDNIKRIMAFAKSEKTAWKMVISVEDVFKDGDTITTKRRPGTKYICIDEWNDAFECDELDKSRVQIGKTLSVTTQNEKTAKQIALLGKKLAKK